MKPSKTCMTKERKLEILDKLSRLLTKYDEIGELVANLLDDALDESDMTFLDLLYELLMPHIKVLEYKNVMENNLARIRKDLEENG